jgi:hypothetical protein
MVITGNPTSASGIAGNGTMHKFNPAAARERCEAATPMKYQVVALTKTRYNVQDGQGYIAAKDLLYEDAIFYAHVRSDLPAALEALEEAQAAGRKAQDEWEEWIESELAGTSQFKPAMREAKKNRAILGESE